MSENAKKQYFEAIAIMQLITTTGSIQYFNMLREIDVKMLKRTTAMQQQVFNKFIGDIVVKYHR